MTTDTRMVTGFNPKIGGDVGLRPGARRSGDRRRALPRNRYLHVVALALAAAAAGFGGGCGSDDPGCVSNAGHLCAKDLAGFPFAQDATMVSDFCGPLQCSGTPPAGATVMIMTHPDAGTLCLSGSIKPGGFAVLALEFPRKNADGTKVLEPFDATARGITQVALTVDSPPAQGAALRANAITRIRCPTNTGGAAPPLECQYPPTFKFAEITAAGPVRAPFADFKSLDDPSQTINPSLLDSVFLQVDSGEFDFCMRDFNFLDAAGNPVRP